MEKGILIALVIKKSVMNHTNASSENRMVGIFRNVESSKSKRKKLKDFMIRDKIDVKITERTFTITLTETEVASLVERLKFKETFIPDLTEPVWKSLEKALGHEVQEHVDL